MEYIPNSSDADLETNENSEKNQLASAQEIRLDRYRGGVVPTNEIDGLLAELQGKIQDFDNFILLHKYIFYKFIYSCVIGAVRTDEGMPGIDFSLILEGLGAGMNINDFDSIGRAIISALTFGIQLGRTGDVSDWPLRHTFKR